MKLLYVVNEAQFFLSHRLPLGRQALASGFDVGVVSAPDTGEQLLAEHGFRHLPVPMSRSEFKLADEFRTYRALREIYQREAPDLVHHVTIKPVVYGSFAAKAANVPAVVNAVPGMGFVFTRRGQVASVRRAFVNTLYRFALSHKNMRVIFQNVEDLRGFLGHAIVRRDQVVLIRGSGVDLESFPAAPEPPLPMIFVLPSRMLKDKGVREFAAAAKVCKQQHPEWQFWLLGGVDPGNPSSLATSEMMDLEKDTGVRWLGHRDNVTTILQQAHVVVLPSYREGVPKVLLEAAATGRAMITSDIAGCREVVTHGVTGMLVAPRSVSELAQAMLQMGEDHAFRTRCAAAARAKAESVFSVDDVVEHTFRVYEELLA